MRIKLGLFVVKKDTSLVKMRLKMKIRPTIKSRLQISQVSAKLSLFLPKTQPPLLKTRLKIRTSPAIKKRLTTSLVTRLQSTTQKMLDLNVYFTLT